MRTLNVNSQQQKGQNVQNDRYTNQNPAPKTQQDPDIRPLPGVNDPRPGNNPSQYPDPLPNEIPSQESNEIPEKKNM